MHFIDSHTHLYKEYYEEDLDAVIQRSLDAKVTKAILPCVNAQTIRDLFDAVEKYPQHLFPLIGLHPTDVTENYLADLDFLEKQLSRPEVGGIGEIGMDLYHETEMVEQQKDAFYRQLAWAKELHLPLSIHIRSAYPDALEILKKFTGCGLTGILHCFSGGIQEAEWALKFGFILGIGGVVTFKNNKLQDIVKAVGLENIALETDAPFLSPTPYRGQRNESANIPIIAQKVADIFETSIERVAEVTSANVERIFGI